MVFSSHQDGSVALGIAAWKGHTEIVQRLLEAGATVNHQNKVYTVVRLSKPHNLTYHVGMFIYSKTSFVRHSE